MPTTSTAQQRFMQMCSKQNDVARGDCPPATVAKGFLSADKRYENMKAKARRAAVKGG